MFPPSPGLAVPPAVTLFRLLQNRSNHRRGRALADRPRHARRSCPGSRSTKRFISLVQGMPRATAALKKVDFFLSTPGLTTSRSQRSRDDSSCPPSLVMMFRSRSAARLSARSPALGKIGDFDLCALPAKPAGHADAAAEPPKAHHDDAFALRIPSVPSVPWRSPVWSQSWHASVQFVSLAPVAPRCCVDLSSFGRVRRNVAATVRPLIRDRLRGLVGSRTSFAHRCAQGRHTQNPPAGCHHRAPLERRARVENLHVFPPGRPAPAR